MCRYWGGGGSKPLHHLDHLFVFIFQNHGYCTRVSPTITDPTDLTDVTTDPADVTGDPADVTGDPTDITVGVENPVTDSGTVPTTAIMAATTKQPVSENELGEYGLEGAEGRGEGGEGRGER